MDDVAGCGTAESLDGFGVATRVPSGVCASTFEPSEIDKYHDIEHGGRASSPSAIFKVTVVSVTDASGSTSSSNTYT